MKLIALSLSLALAAVALGCGGGDATSSAPTKSEFITRAGTICSRAGKEQFTAFGRALNGNPESANKKELEDVTLQVVLPRARKMVRELAQLEAPEGQAEQLATLVKSYEAGLKRAEEYPATFLSGKAVATADEEAKALGLNECEL